MLKIWFTTKNKLKLNIRNKFLYNGKIMFQKDLNRTGTVYKNAITTT